MVEIIVIRKNIINVNVMIMFVATVVANSYSNGSILIFDNDNYNLNSQINNISTKENNYIYDKYMCHLISKSFF